MKKLLFILVSVSLLAAGCIKTQPVTSVPSNNTNTNSAKKDSPSTTNSGFIQTNKTPQPKHNTSKWKVYQDKHISFKYPGDWRVEDNTKSDTIVSLSLTDLKKEYTADDGHSVVAPINIAYWPDKSGGAEKVANYKDMRDTVTGEKILQQKTKLIGDRQAYVLYGSRSAQQVFINERFLFTNGFHFRFSSNGQTLGRYGGYGDKVAQQIDDIFETVLSTVTFPAGK